MSDKIIHITSMDQLEALTAENPDKPIVIDFHATWCGPCHQIAPAYERLANEYPGLIFTKCDVDVGEKVAQHFQISAMPTFKLIKGGVSTSNVLETTRGANQSALTELIQRHSATIMSITHITSLSQLNDILKKAGDKLTVIDFHATWCGPCHAIAPKYESLAKEYTNVTFLKCDVDAAAPVSKEYSVSAMPTFVFIKNSKKIDQVRGADPRALEATIRSHATPGAFSGKGQTLGSSSTTDTNSNAGGRILGMDPQMQLLLGLVGGYLLLTYFVF